MRKVLITILLTTITLTTFAQTKPKPVLTQIVTTDSVLNSFILKWLGKPYKLGGSTEKGIDCSQFNKRLYRDVYNKSLKDVAYKQWNETIRVKRDSLRLGDLIFFRSKLSPSGWHCAVYLGENYFIHAANRYEGVKISSLSEPRYRLNYRGAGRKL